MNIEKISQLVTDGDSYIEYNMCGFNALAAVGKDVEFCLEITDNKPYLYKNHEFLYSFCIDDNFKKIVFKLKKGCDAWDYKERINFELERLCINLIMHENMHTFIPICTVYKIVTTRKSTNFEDKILFSDKLKYTIKEDGCAFYKEIAEGKNKVLEPEHYSVYKQIFDILKCPNLALQYMALYDLLKALLSSSNNKSQKNVTEFFKKNNNRYKVSFEKTRKIGKSNNEDCYTHLRNKIGHPYGLSPNEIQALGVNEGVIKALITIINDIKCENAST